MLLGQLMNNILCPAHHLKDLQHHKFFIFLIFLFIELTEMLPGILNQLVRFLFNTDDVLNILKSHVVGFDRNFYGN